MGSIITPSSGQLQVPGSFRSYARIIVSSSSLQFVGQEFTVDGGPIAILPDAGFISWKYINQGVSRWGAKLPIELSQQFIQTDIENMEIESLLVVLRRGVTASVSIRRFPT